MHIGAKFKTTKFSSKAGRQLHACNSYSKTFPANYINDVW